MLINLNINNKQYNYEKKNIKYFTFLNKKVLYNQNIVNLINNDYYLLFFKDLINIKYFNTYFVDNNIHNYIKNFIINYIFLTNNKKNNQIKDSIYSLDNIEILYDTLNILKEIDSELLTSEKRNLNLAKHIDLLYESVLADPYKDRFIWAKYRIIGEKNRTSLINFKKLKGWEIKKLNIWKFFIDFININTKYYIKEFINWMLPFNKYSLLDTSMQYKSMHNVLKNYTLYPNYMDNRFCNLFDVHSHKYYYELIYKYRKKHKLFQIDDLLYRYQSVNLPYSINKNKLEGKKKIKGNIPEKKVWLIKKRVLLKKKQTFLKNLQFKFYYFLFKKPLNILQEEYEIETEDNPTNTSYLTTKVDKNPKFRWLWFKNIKHYIYNFNRMRDYDPDYFYPFIKDNYLFNKHFMNSHKYKYKFNKDQVTQRISEIESPRLYKPISFRHLKISKTLLKFNLFENIFNIDTAFNRYNKYKYDYDTYNHSLNFYNRIIKENEYLEKKNMDLLNMIFYYKTTTFPMTINKHELKYSKSSFLEKNRILKKKHPELFIMKDDITNNDN